MTEPDPDSIADYEHEPGETDSLLGPESSAPRHGTREISDIGLVFNEGIGDTTQRVSVTVLYKVIGWVDVGVKGWVLVMF